MKTNNRTNSNIKNDQINKDNLIEETENKKEEQGKKIEEKQEKGEQKEKICLDLEILNSWNLPIG